MSAECANFNGLGRDHQIRMLIFEQFRIWERTLLRI